MQEGIEAMGAHSDAAFTVTEFCRSHKISRSLFYVLVRNGQGPRLMHPRGRVLISREAATAWRSKMEKAEA